MLSDENLKALIEAIIYVAPEPVSLDAILKVLGAEERDRVKAKLEELSADYQLAQHGIHVRQVAAGYKFSTKPEHHEVLRKFVKSLKPPIRLSNPALETLAVIAYRQPVTLPEIDEIRGVDCGGVIHTLMEKKLVVTSGRKNVVGRPILYRTSRDFLVHFGLKDVSELPSLKEFEELAKRALGPEWAAIEKGPVEGETSAAIEPPPQDEAVTDSQQEETACLAEEATPLTSSEFPEVWEEATSAGSPCPKPTHSSESEKAEQTPPVIPGGEGEAVTPPAVPGTKDER